MTDTGVIEGRTKYERISELSERHTLAITEDAGSWADFLTSSAAMYKYPWADQLLIHAQKPDASACASMGMWNGTFGRMVKRGSRGIALIDRNGIDRDGIDRGDIGRLKYVFDISDTAEVFLHLPEGAKRPAQPYIWSMREEHEQSVLESLEYEYGEYGATVREQIEGLVEASVTDPSLADEEGYLKFRDLTKATALYTIFTRCGLDAGDTAEIERNFKGIEEYNTVESVSELGSAAAEISFEVLRHVERAVKDYERAKNQQNTQITAEQTQERSYEHGGRENGGAGHEQPDVPAGGTIPDTQPDGGRAGGYEVGQTRQAGQVRDDEEGLSGEPQEGAVRGASFEGEPAEPPDGHRGNGAAEDRNDNDADVGERPGPGQGERPDGLGAAHEHDEGAGGGSHPRPDIRVTRGKAPEPESKETEHGPDSGPRQLELPFFFPDEEEQISAIRNSHTDNPGENTLTDEDINFALCLNGPFEGTKKRIASICMESARPQEIAAFLKKEFGIGGRTVVYPDGVWGYMEYNAKGIQLTKRPDKSVNLTWAAAGNRITDLVVSERYGVNLIDLGFEPVFPHINPVNEPISVDAAPNVTSSIETQAAEESEDAAQEPASRLDYRIPSGERDYGGQKTRFKANVEAIKALKTIEGEKRLATEDEQEILSRFVGWGGIPQAFDQDNEKWAGEYAELKGLLTGEEYDSARASTLNAHYTSPTVIRAIYKALDNMGYAGGKILEPAMGIGNFFGLLPDGMKENSELHGVELDGISGRIAKQLYQTASIQVSGFEETVFPDGYFNAAVGNVPFGSYTVTDRNYADNNFLVHDYFLAKSLDLVRPGGVAAFITSKGTMDKQNPSVRKYLAERAELLGAVRLPNDAFKENAGTEVTADILFLRRRERVIDVDLDANPPEWIHTGYSEDRIPLNDYFIKHPEMLLGKMVREDKLYGSEDGTACVPFERKDLSELLEQAVNGIEGKILNHTPEIDEQDGQEEESIPADPGVRNWSFTLVNEKVYYRRDSRMYREELSPLEEGRVKGLLELEGLVKSIISYQQHDYPDYVIQEQQAELSKRYDRFTRMYGLVNDRANARVFDKDGAYYLLCSLEVLDENGRLERKADIFDKRTIRRYSPPSSVDTPTEALAVSLAEKARVDLDYMSALTGMERGKIVADLKGVIFANPAKKDGNGDFIYETADEYLSGYVKQKLQLAEAYAARYPSEANEADNADKADKKAEPDFSVNVAALKEAQPQRLEAKDINVRLGATWIEQDYPQQFMYELLDTPIYMRSLIEVEYSPHTGEWHISNTGYDNLNVKANVTYGTKRANAYEIIRDTLNLKDVRIYDTVKDADGKERRVLNRKETILAQMKQEAIKNEFKDWIFRDAQRREALVEKYNALFNNTQPREYDGSHLVFPGMSPEISLRKHQTAAIARIMYGGNTLLAHEVGAGKTYEMVGAAMEMKRLGLCNKSLMVVPNHLTEQMASEFLRLYPAANILVTTKKDFEKNNRKKFCARIASGDFDAIIMGHSQFEKIPISHERQVRFIREQIWEITDALEDMARQNSSKRNFGVKQLEKTKKSLEARLKKLNDEQHKDDVVCFEELGIDRLFVDEAHAFKNLYLYTKMRNVAGIPQVEAKKSSDMQMKCRYMDETTGNKGVIFATGTPAQNSMTDIYTMMRYLQNDRLNEMRLKHFDCWASTFGEVTTSIELAPEGSGYRSRTRFSKFYNLPELMRVFREAADIKTADTLDLPRPEAVFHNIVVEPSETQKILVQELSKRAEKISNGNVDPSVDNMLVITSDGRKIGLDQRLIDPAYPDEPGSKVNTCMENIHRIWEETKEKKSAQILFCDFSTPQKASGAAVRAAGISGTEAGDVAAQGFTRPEKFGVSSASGKPGRSKFNVYDDIKAKLLQKGVPEREIAYIHDADSEQKKKELFAKVRNGSVRILMGSTQKMGAGTNVQDRLIALHSLDCPWRPSDLEQRDGRIIRQGNTNERVHIYRYSTKDTLDAYLWQTVENKQKYISQVMTSKSPARSCDDVDESVLSYAEIKALCAGNPLIREKMDLDVQVSKLKMARSSHQHNVYELQDKLRNHFPAWIRHTEQNVEALKHDEALAAKTREDKGNDENAERKFPGMTLLETDYSDKKEAGEALMKLCAAAGSSPIPLGTYRGFEMTAKAYELQDAVEITLKGKAAHVVTTGRSEDGNILRLDNALDAIGRKVLYQEERLDELRSQVRAAQEEVEKPFPMEAELEQKSNRLNELNISLSLDDKSLNSGAILPDSVADGSGVDYSEEPEKTPGERETLIGNAKQKLGFNSIVTDAQRGRGYSGDVLEVGEEYAVQKISRGVGIIHSFGKAPGLPGAIAEHGMKDIAIRYDKSGKCSVVPKENEQARQAEATATY